MKDGNHPHVVTDEHHDDHEDGYVPPILIIDLPPLCDEAAMQFSELLKDFLQQFDEYYRREIRRAVRARRKEEERRIRELKARAAQMQLPGFDDAPPF
jgi:hypothetical protein